MERPFTPNHHRVVISNWLDKEIAPNTYSVIHLRRTIDGQLLTQDMADQISAKLMAQISKAFIGKSEFRRRPPGKRLIPNCVSIERTDTLPHFNILLRRPDWMSLLQCQVLIADALHACPWYRNDEGAFYCEERDPDRHPILYSIKEGTDALLTRSLSVKGS